MVSGQKAAQRRHCTARTTSAMIDPDAAIWKPLTHGKTRLVDSIYPTKPFQILSFVRQIGGSSSVNQSPTGSGNLIALLRQHSLIPRGQICGFGQGTGYETANCKCCAGIVSECACLGSHSRLERFGALGRGYGNARRRKPGRNQGRRHCYW